MIGAIGCISKLIGGIAPIGIDPLWGHPLVLYLNFNYNFEILLNVAAEKIILNDNKWIIDSIFWHTL